MKSLLALHLLTLLLINLATFNFVGQTTASVAEIMSATTTSQPPSLRAPHRSTAVPTRVMSRRSTTTTTSTTTSTSTPTTSTVRSLTASAARRQRPPIARSSASHAKVKHLMDVDSATAVKKSNLNSTRPLRSIITTTTTAVNTRTSGARQNRSLQQQTATSSLAAQNSGNSLTAAGKINEQKHERVDRRYQQQQQHQQHSRTNQRGSNSNNETTIHATFLPSALNAPGSAPERHHFPTKVLEASHRQSKESSMPSVVVVEKKPKLNSDDQQATKQQDAKTPAHINGSNKPRQTSKTPRMIHRLVAGHIQNAEGRSSYQVSAVTSNSSVSSSSTTTPKTSSTAATTLPVKSSAKYTASASSTVAPIKLQSILDLPDDEREDDEALLDDPGDFDNWDNGILRLSAGSGKENAKPKKHSKTDDSKKTLADQVRDGKYGLIEKELFRREPKRPGILSYLPNKEVPIDNEHNFGGLNEEDIWLAEDHLLVIKGGSLNEEKPNEAPWPAIDDYDSPGRQIKIPPNPKVPPPFPVQLEENGPVQFIGNNKFTVVYPVANESIPVYSIGPETDHAPSETDIDNEKNSLTRPGTPQDITDDGQPHYVYPAPYPPWLYSNQTFVNPLLSNARPITFPGLGPFPFGRNGSLENSNITDYFDEDDPNLYYPPAYSFVYKNNYTNPVPPGPLVPGIVLPPPPNQFSRLEKVEKPSVTTLKTILTRQRVPTTTTFATTTTTSTSTTTTRPIPSTISTTTTTTDVPFRPVITKISEYTPKIINITPATPAISTSLPATPIVKIPVTPPATPTTPPTPPQTYAVEPIPVPVAVPIPITYFKKLNKYPSSKPSIVSFVPTTPQPHVDTLSKSNPIYYEYFEAKRQPIKTNVIDDFLATTVEPPPSPKPIKLYATSKRPFKAHQHQQHQHRNYLQPVTPQRIPFKENVVYITPKPEIRYKSPSKVPPPPPLLKQRPLENFEREVDALRETLRYYQNQQLRDNSIPRTPKVKPIYEFSFDATKNLQTHTNNEFRPPLDFDDEPFKPMVTYSPPMNDENSFNPMAFDKADKEVLTPESKRLDDERPQYPQSTTTLISVQPEDAGNYPPQAQSLRLGKQRLSSKYLQEPFTEGGGGSDGGFEPQPDPYNNQRPWVAIGKDNYEATVDQQQQQRFEQYQYGVPKNRAYNGGYYYGPPQPARLTSSRQNNRFYNEPFHRQQQRPQFNYQQPQQQQQNYWSLENDTYVNYAPNRPPINPDAEWINPYQASLPLNAYAAAGGQGGGRYPLPALSHQSQYYAPPSRPIPLHRDILVNYRQPLPPINPDSEFITHPQVVRNQGNQIYRSDSYQRLSPPPPPPLENNDEQSNLYYASPKYRRANNNNNNNGNNSNNNRNANKQVREPRSSSNTNSDINNGK